MSRSTTIEDVASEAGVSVATVSRALRGLPNVAPSTRDRVQEVARRMNYRPDPRAASLAAGRTNTVAMAVPLLGGWYFSQVMAGAEAVLREAAYDLLLFTVDGDDRRRRLLAGPLVKRADGLLLVDVRVPDDEAEGLVTGDVPVVAVGIEIPGAASVMVDDRRIGRDAVAHLIELGHTAIALVEGLPDDPLRFAVPTERRRGYEDALRAAGLPLRPDLAVAGNFSVSGGTEAMRTLLDLADPPTAVFAMSDEMAFGALHEIWGRGMRTPDDISVVGVDDHEFAHVIGLTTVQQQVAEHGAVAARMMLDILSGGLEGPPARHTAAADLVIRATTGPVPA